MTDSALLAAIKASTTAKAQADAANDSGVADTINAGLPKPVPITTTALLQAAPQTLEAIAAGASPLSEMEVIASRVRDGDAAGIGNWAATLHLLTKMNDTEFAAVNSLVAAATAGDSVDHSQVSRVLQPFRLVFDADHPQGVARAVPIDWSKA